MQNSNQRSTRLVQISLCLLCQFAFLTAATLQAYATNGLPQSTKFGFGARLDPWGEQVDVALMAAVDNGLDWIGVDFDWNRHWPESNNTLDLAKIDYIMGFAATNDLSVLLSITNPPAWVLTPAGPDPEATAGLVAQFTRLYPDALKAIELFPAANTQAGWGASPNPRAYAGLLQAVSDVLHRANKSTVLVAAGLVPVGSPDPAVNIEDLVFLQQLYTEGAARFMPVVGVRFPVLTGDPLAAPLDEDARVLRRYELIRNIMLENGHKKGLLWVTGFSWPDAQHDRNKSTNPDTQSSQIAIESAQSHWLTHAHQMMKSQLYLGAAFYDCLNSPTNDDIRTSNQRCLIQTNQGNTYIHPALTSLGYLNKLSNNQRTWLVNSSQGTSAIPFDLKDVWKWISP